MRKEERLVILVLLMIVIASVFCCRETAAWSGNSSSAVMPFTGNSAGGVSGNKGVNAQITPAQTREADLMRSYSFVLSSHLGFDPRTDLPSADSPDVNKFAIIILDNANGYLKNSFGALDKELIVNSLTEKGWPESNINWVIIDSSSSGFDFNRDNPPAAGTESESLRDFWDSLFPPAAENILMDSNDQVLVVLSSEGEQEGTYIDRMDPDFLSGYIQRLPGETALVIDSCYSGDSMDNYKSSGSLILTSSDDTASAQRFYKSSSVFLTELAEGISLKDSLEEAFTYAKDRTEFNLDTFDWRNNFAYTSGQSPQILDNQPGNLFLLNYRDSAAGAETPVPGR